MARTRVKICGITRLEDAQVALNAGADALGFVFYAPSPRAVTVEQAEAIIRKLPPFVTTLGLFVNAPGDQIERTVQRCALDLIQFHGDEPEEECRSFSRPYIKALRMKPDLNLEAQMAAYPSARAFLLDAYKKGVPGGTGEQFDWSRVPRESGRPIVLAGGLKPENIAQAIEQTLPYAVDVSGGVEASPGVKDPVRIKKFMSEVFRVSSSD